jgi:hypothetical protein
LKKTFVNSLDQLFVLENVDYFYADFEDNRIFCIYFSKLEKNQGNLAQAYRFLNYQAMFWRYVELAALFDKERHYLILRHKNHLLSQFKPMRVAKAEVLVDLFFETLTSDILNSNKSKLDYRDLEYGILKRFFDGIIGEDLNYLTDLKEEKEEKSGKGGFLDFLIPNETEEDDGEDDD